MALGGGLTLRGQYGDLFFDRLPFIDEILFEQFNAHPLEYSQVFNVRDSARAFENVTAITGFGTFSEKSEGDTIDYDKTLQGFDRRFTHVTYSKGVNISFEAAEDDIDGAISDVMPPLARAARTSIEITAWDVINNSFGTSTTPDGQPLYSDSHVLVGGGTYDNLVSGDMSISNLETAINLFDDMVDDRGLPIQNTPSMLVYPTNLRWLVHEILKSELRADTANNATNALNQVGLGTLMCHYLTGDDDWFLFSSPSEHRVLFYWRKDPVTDHTVDFDTGNYKTKMTYRCSQGAADWRNTVGGQGA